MFLYWYSVVLLFIVVLKYLQRNRTIRYIKFFFFCFEKIDNFVRVEKFRFVEYDVVIITYVVFFECQIRKILMKSYFIRYSMKIRNFIFSLLLSAFVSLKSENVLQLNTLRWAISFRIDSFSNFCMKINDESQLSVDEDVRFNMCAATK